jgi:hypothetical protein
MNHKSLHFPYKKTQCRLSPVRRKTAIGLSFVNKSVFAYALFALLVGNAARRFAGRLAGGLAFAAAALSKALFKVARFDGQDTFHNDYTSMIILPTNYHNPALLSTDA